MFTLPPSLLFKARVPFESAARFVETGLVLQRQVATLWRRRHAIELEYSRALSKLAHLDLIPDAADSEAGTGTGTLASAEDPSQDQEQQPGATACVREMMVVMAAEAKQHEVFAGLLDESAASLLAQTQRLDAERKHLISEHVSGNRAMHEAHVHLKKAQEQSASLDKERDDAVQCLARAKHAARTKESHLHKLRTRSEAAIKKATAAAGQLTVHETFCDRMRRSHYESELPRLLTGVEAIEVQHAADLVMGMALVVENQGMLAGVMQDGSAHVGKACKSADSRVDLEAFVNKARAVAPTSDVPATALTAPTIKGHLSFQKADESKGWKTSVFVLMALELKMYQYSGEDARRPQKVHTVNPAHIRLTSRA